jgi:regulator of sigma E protease
MAFLVVEILRNMFSGDVPLSELGGPIAIAEASVTAARFGLVRLFELLALLSINVAVLNLLPIPILDGGQILLNVAETARGRAFSVRTREYILRAGLLAIGLLFVLVMFNDIKRLVERLIN